MQLKGGLKLEGKKESAYIQWTIKRLRLPQKISIPLVYSTSNFSEACVAVNETVAVGQKIANPSNDQSVPVFSGVHGKVIRFDYAEHPLLGEVPAIEIETLHEEPDDIHIFNDTDESVSLTADELRACFRERGLVEMTNVAEALHSKTKRLQSQKPEVVVINAVETQPYVTDSYSMLMSHPVEILKGADILRQAVGAKGIVIAVGENEREAVELLKSKIFFLKWEHCQVETVSSLYPQEQNDLLMRTLKLRENTNVYANGCEPFDAATAFAAYQGVAQKKPLIERAVSLAGECLIEPKVTWLRFGTSIDYAFKLCRGLMRDPDKVIMGGPMNGAAQKTLLGVAFSMTNAFLALPKEVTREGRTEECDLCGDCLNFCPADISPAMITLAAEKGRMEMADDYGLQSCIECGNCAYVCPSKRPMMELIRYAKTSL